MRGLHDGAPVPDVQIWMAARPAQFSHRTGPTGARRSQEGPRRESPTPMVIARGEPPLTVATDWFLRRNEIPSHVA